MWLTEFREQWGLSIELLGTLIRRYAARRDPKLRVSDTLLERLETEANFRTVPKLADVIALACGATAAQRDEMVLERFRGRPYQSRAKAGEPPVIALLEQARGGGAQIRPPKPAPEPHTRPVVMIDKNGEELLRYRSIVSAVEDSGICKEAILSRINRTKQMDEFEGYGVSFRLAEEWDKMTEAQRKADAQRTKPHKPGKAKPKPQGWGGARHLRAVTVVDPDDGQVFHYDSVTEAAEATGFKVCTMYKRVDAFDPLHIRPIGGYIWMSNEDWKRLPPELREKLTAGNY